MRIKKLQLHNFGVYAGDNEFVFECKKPVVLIGGMNGRGKTTFLEAVLLALYGSNSFAYTESGKRSYIQYLKSFINRKSEDQTCSVTLEFEIDNGIKENYIITRKWDTLAKKTKEDICVLKDGIYNEFLTNNWPMFIENILPSALSNFFFFDGEKIAELAVDNTNEQLKNSIRSMLGITVLDVLKNDIQRNLKKISKNSEEGKSEKEVQQLKEQKDKAIETLEKLDIRLEKLYVKLNKDQTQLEKMHQLYTAKGGDAFEKRQDIMKKRAALIARLSTVDSQLYEKIADQLPFLMVKDLISEIKLQATDEHTEVVMQEAVQELDHIYEDFSENYTGNPIGGKDFLEYIKKYIGEKPTEIIYGLSDQALFQVNNMVEGSLKNTVKDTETIIEYKRNLKKQIGEFDSYLSLDINDKEITAIYKKIKDIEQIVIDDQVKIKELEQKRNDANSKVNSLTIEFNRNVEEYLSNAELHDTVDRTKKYSHMALNIIENYQIELQKRKTNVLAETITVCYKKLANKKNLIQQIIMDPETLHLTYLSKDNDEVPKDSLSAGEKQLMVISILWALAICSKKKLPVIIDTPLSRLDSSHRTALITKYFPYAGEQTIILSTDSEIDAYYYELMKENVDDEFTLIYDENTKSTSIEKGYMIGAEL